ncbi:MAG: hypothetical protein ACRDP6_14580 [Actinoallomurus sp.]
MTSIGSPNTRYNEGHDMKRLLTAAAAASVLLTAAACTDSAASAAPKHGKAHKATSHVVTARAHVSGSGGAARWFLTLRGKKQPASVSKTSYRRCQIGDHYPACADG